MMGGLYSHLGVVVPYYEDQVLIFHISFIEHIENRVRGPDLTW